MVWEDGGYFEACQRSWRIGDFFKLRGTLATHEKYGAQIEPEMIRPVSDRDREDGFTELDFLERSRFEMYARCLARDRSDGPFTERDPSLGRALLKRRRV